MAKMWAGRTAGSTDKIADDFNSSIHFDKRMYKQDIEGSMAHAAMLAKCGIITPEDADMLTEGLKGILTDLESGELQFDLSCEDIHMFVEQVLTERIGDTGKKLHTARSRNDQVALDLRMYLRDEASEIMSLIRELTEELTAVAEKNMGLVMPGYTHLQRAQPILFSHHIMAYAMMLLRDKGRMEDTVKRMNVSPIGSCALAGTTYETDRVFEAERLGFGEVAMNSLDGVSDRDFCLEFMSALSILMMHLSRFSEELVLWSSWEFKFIELSDLHALFLIRVMFVHQHDLLVNADGSVFHFADTDASNVFVIVDGADQHLSRSFRIALRSGNIFEDCLKERLHALRCVCKIQNRVSRFC